MPNSDVDGVDPVGIRSTDLSVIVEGAGVVDLRVNPSVAGGELAFTRLSIAASTSSVFPMFVDLLELAFVKALTGETLLQGAASVIVFNDATAQTPNVFVRMALDGVPIDVANVGVTPHAAPTITSVGAGVSFMSKLLLAAGAHSLKLQWCVLGATNTAQVNPGVDSSAMLSALGVAT